MLCSGKPLYTSSLNKCTGAKPNLNKNANTKTNSIIGSNNTPLTANLLKIMLIKL